MEGLAEGGWTFQEGGGRLEEGSKPVSMVVWCWYTLWEGVQAEQEVWCTSLFCVSRSAGSRL